MTETQTRNIRTRLVKYIIEGLYKMDGIQGYRNHPIIHQFNLDVVQSIKKYLKAGEIYMYHDDKASHDEKGGILIYIFPVFIPAMFDVFYEYPVGSDEIIFCDDPVGTYHEGLVVMERVYEKTPSVVHLAESRSTVEYKGDYPDGISVSIGNVTLYADLETDAQIYLEGFMENIMEESE